MLTVVALAAVGVYVALVALLWAGQERVVFQPPRMPTPRMPAPGGARLVEYRASDGAELFAYVAGDPTQTAGLLIAFHGNADLARWTVPWAIEVARRTGLAVMIPEIRGYDNLPGSPTYGAAQLDSRAALRFALTQLKANPESISFFGHSLGSAIATELTDVLRPRALILQSPFTSARGMAGRMGVPGLPALWRLISRVGYETEQRVRDLDVPVFVAHGTRDFVIPVAMGRAVYAAARVKGDLLIVDGAGHNDVADVAGERYWGWLVRATSDGGRGTANVPSPR